MWWYLFISSQLALLASSAGPEQDFSQYVNVFAGTTNGGNMFPGAVAGPFAPVKLGPDMSMGSAEAYSGYLPDTPAAVTGFSMMHESGTGGAPKYGVVAQMPAPGSIRNPLIDISSKRSRPDEGSVGYYKSSLESGVTVELAATNHAGFYQYSFPSGQQSNVIVDVSHVLDSFRGMGWGQIYNGGSFSIASDRHYEGSGIYAKSWNLAPDWTIYFCGKFDQVPTLAQAFVGKNQTLSEFGKNSNVSSKDRVGGVFSFKESQITSRVAVSWTSTGQACRYLDDEIPAGTKLSDVVNASKARWNTEVFAKMTTTDTNRTILQQLYTSLYGMHLLPSNRTGDNPSWPSSEPYYDDIYTFWDLFRCTTPLFHILQPVAYEELLRSIVDVWRHEGWLPDGRSSNFNGRTQGGSNADNVLADAYVKGVRGAVNWDDAYAAMQTDAEKVPPPNNDPSAPDSSTKQGRGALPDWLQHGYITPKFSRAVTRGVEYAGNDFALHQVAKGLGKNDDAIKYIRRSRNWRNHWNPEAESLGTKGFLVPRMANGSFMKQNPMNCGGCYWREAYYEGKPWEYSVGAHHDMGELINMSGGPQNFTQRLNTLMDPDKKIFNPGNEPSFTTPYLYNFAGRQDLSVKQSRKVAKTFYSAGVGGLPGASDAGAMQSWILWNMIGLYPLTGQTTFLVGSPWFQQLSISLPNGKALNVTTTGGDSDSNFYVQSLQVNGQPWNKNWVTWDDIFANGGSMEFALGSSPVRWDTGDLPPSPASRKSSNGDNGGAAKITPPQPQVVGEVPVPHSDRHLKTAAIIVGVIGFVTIFTGIFVYTWLRRSRALRNKDTAIDAEGSTANSEREMEAKRKEAVVQIREVGGDTSDSGSEAGTSGDNIRGGQQSRRAQSATTGWRFWKRRKANREEVS